MTINFSKESPLFIKAITFFFVLLLAVNLAQSTSGEEVIQNRKIKFSSNGIISLVNVSVHEDSWDLEVRTSEQAKLTIYTYDKHKQKVNTRSSGYYTWWHKIGKGHIPPGENGYISLKFETKDGKTSKWPDTPTGLYPIERPEGICPKMVHDFQATDEDDGQTTLYWTNPDQEILDAVMVRRNEGTRPLGGKGDGKLIYENLNPEPGADVSITAQGLDNRKRYFYAVYTKSDYGNWNNITRPTFGGFGNSDIAMPAESSQLIVRLQPKVVKPGELNFRVGVYDKEANPVSGAKIYINGHLRGSTDENGLTSPNNYWGYFFSWTRVNLIARKDDMSGSAFLPVIGRDSPLPSNNHCTVKSIPRVFEDDGSPRIGVFDENLKPVKDARIILTYSGREIAKTVENGLTVPGDTGHFGSGGSGISGLNVEKSGYSDRKYLQVVSSPEFEPDPEELIVRLLPRKVNIGDEAESFRIGVFNKRKEPVSGAEVYISNHKIAETGSDGFTQLDKSWKEDFQNLEEGIYPIIADDGKKIGLELLRTVNDPIYKIPYVISHWQVKSGALDPHAGPTIDTDEILQAIAWWADDYEVPLTGGKKITTNIVLTLINYWANERKITNTNTNR